jgi:hypothetical protein
MTAIATVSVVSGVRAGIRRLSEVNWLLAQFIAFVYFFQDDTWYLLNVLVQSTGYYTQWLIQLGTWTNAFQNSPMGASGLLCAWNACFADICLCGRCEAPWNSKAHPWTVVKELAHIVCTYHEVRGTELL